MQNVNNSAHTPHVVQLVRSRIAIAFVAVARVVREQDVAGLPMSLALRPYVVFSPAVLALARPRLHVHGFATEVAQTELSDPKALSL
jgi:hypothetical protein